MFSDFMVQGQDSASQIRDAWRRKQCDSCGIRPTVCPAPVSMKQRDIMVITDFECVPIVQHLHRLPYTYFETKIIECADKTNVMPLEQEKESCLGRKLAMLRQAHPQIVICVGAKAYFTIESAAGFTGDMNADLIPMPTELDGHVFWLIQVPQFGLAVQHNVNRFNQLIHECMAKAPYVHKPTFENIELVTTGEEAKAAFADLMKMPYVAADIETNGLRPYFNNAKILSIALGTKDKTYAIPISHPQTSVSIDPFEIFEGIDQLSKKSQMIAFSNHFEYEWLSHFMGTQFLLNGLWDDVQMQIYVLRNKPFSLSLNNACRRTLGFDLKAQSNINRAKLEEAPLEQVLVYNGGDTVETHRLFEIYKAEIERLGIVPIYQRRIENVWAHVPLSKRGVDVDWNFVYEQKHRLDNLADDYSKEFKQIPEVQAYEGKYGNLKVSQVKKIGQLYKEFLGVSQDVTSFDDDFLKNFDHPLSTVIKHYREESKLCSTYLDPLIQDYRGMTPWLNGNKSKCQVMEDGLIHGLFQAWGTVTGRPSGTNMNMLNWPSRGVTGSGFKKKNIRKAVKARKGYKFVSIDYAQIEARVIASLAKDAAYLKQLWEDFDIHLYWTKRVEEEFPGYFFDLAKRNTLAMYEASLTTLRKDWKNTWTFPLLYNSAEKSVYENAALLISNLELRAQFSEAKFYALIKEFWAAYPAIKPWQEGLGVEMDATGKIVTPFGQEMHDLKKTEYCNYSSQSAAADICSKAQYRILQKALKENDGRFFVLMNIYDDLTMEIREDCLDEVLEEIVPIMVDTSHLINTKGEKWYLAPLEVEVSVGDNWGNQEKYLVFSSKDLEGLAA